MEFEKNGKEISFLKKIGNFLLKYLFEKKNLLQYSPHPHDNAGT